LGLSFHRKNNKAPLQNIHNQKHPAKIHHGFIAQARDKTKPLQSAEKQVALTLGLSFPTPRTNNEAPRKTFTTKNNPPQSTTVLSRKRAIKTKPLQHAEKQVALTSGLSFHTKNNKAPLQNIHHQKHPAKIHHGFIAQERDKNKAPPTRRKTSRSHIGAFFSENLNTGVVHPAGISGKWRNT